MKLQTNLPSNKLYYGAWKHIFDMAAKQPINVLISYPRSGKDWMRKIIYATTGKKVAGRDDYNNNRNEYWGIADHFIENIAETMLNRIHDFKPALLLRDPRDSALSEAYRRIFFNHATNKFTDSLLNNTIDRAIESWGWLYDNYIDKCFLIQYEHICLYPERTIKSFHEYFSSEITSDITKTIIALDLKCNYKLSETNGVIRDRRATVYENNWMRYISNCKKWKYYDVFKQKHNDRIFEVLGDRMQKLGYLYKDHDIVKWGVKI